MAKTIKPTTKAIATDNKIPKIIFIAEAELITCQASSKLPNFQKPIISAAPKSSNTTETVVEVGKPNVEYKSSNIISANTTPKNIVITSPVLKKLGVKIPFLATSIIPSEKVAPIINGGGGGQKTLATAGGQDASNLQKVIDSVRSLLVAGV